MDRIILATLALIFGLYGAYLLASGFIGMNPVDPETFVLNPTVAYMQLTTLILGIGAIIVSAILVVGYLIVERR